MTGTSAETTALFEGFVKEHKLRTPWKRLTDFQQVHQQRSEYNREQAPQQGSGQVSEQDFEVVHEQVLERGSPGGVIITTCMQSSRLLADIRSALDKVNNNKGMIMFL